MGFSNGIGNGEKLTVTHPGDLASGQVLSYFIVCSNTEQLMRDFLSYGKLR